MKAFTIIVLFFFIGIHRGLSQDSSVLISAKMFSPEQKIFLSSTDGWIFKVGNDSSWANKEINASGWERLNPPKLSAKLADSTGRVEGWFRYKFTLSDDFQNMSLGIARGSWAATDIYIDGNFFASFGNTGQGGKLYKEYNPNDKLAKLTKLQPGKEYVLAVHFVDYIAPLSFWSLKSATIGGNRSQSEGLHSLLAIANSNYNPTLLKTSHNFQLYRTAWLSVTMLLTLFFWLMFFFQSPGDKKILMLISIYSTSSTLSNLTRFFLRDPNVAFLTYRINDLISKLSFWAILVLTFIITKRILSFKITSNTKSFLIAFSLFGGFSIFFNYFTKFLMISTLASFLFYAYILLSFRRKVRGSQWSIVAGLSLSTLFGVLFIIFNFKGYNSSNWMPLMTGIYFSFPLSLLIYVSLRFKELNKEKEARTLHEQRLHRELLELEAQALRAQMNPHFIYNCMNSIKALIQNDDKFRSIEYLTTFSKLIRTLFNNSDKRQISLHDEIETCKLYTQLEAMRLNGKLKYAFDIDPNLDLKSLIVPALIVQPFIENAIWHGIVPNNHGIINISVKGNEESIVCEVDDDGIGREKSRLNKPITPIIHESKGVHLSQRRLSLEKMLNDTSASIETIDKYENSIAAGTKVKISFNLN